MRSVRTTFQILDAVADNQPIGLSELARRLKLPKSTVQRSLATLAELGWIHSDGTPGARWVLGARVRMLSERVDDLRQLRQAALPAIEQLNTDTIETIHLAVFEGDTMRLIERMDSKHPLRLVRPIGTRSPLHASSTGKSVLAHLSEADITAHLESRLPQVATNTITDPDLLRTELQRVREQGFAVSNEEFTDGIVSVAASIRPYGGQPIAAISLSGAAVRMPERLRTCYGQKVAAAAVAIAERLRVR